MLTNVEHSLDLQSLAWQPCCLQHHYRSIANESVNVSLYACNQNEI